jgi:hypothetical protein
LLKHRDLALVLLKTPSLKAMKAIFCLFLALILSNAVTAQSIEDTVYNEPLRLSGPRVGVTIIGGDLGKMLTDNGMKNYISQFGWQFETRYFSTSSGFQGLVEFVPILGGFENDNPTLSATLLVGFRTPEGFEIGAGPNISTAEGGSHSFIFAVGVTAHTDDVNIPVNLAIAPSSNSTKYTLLIGFNVRRK